MTNITTAAGRKRLKPSPEPYWHKLQKGRYVGFRAGADTWQARTYLNGSNVFKTLDDARDFETARALAEAWFVELTGGAKAHYTVDDAIRDYIEHRRIENGKDSAHEAKLILEKRVLPKFKGRELSSITTAELLRWRNGFDPRTDDDAARRAKDTANKYVVSLRACFNVAFTDGLVADDTAWRRLKPFPKVNKEREFFPTREQVDAHIAECDVALRPLVRALALTGFRLGALTSARVADFDPEHATLRISADKGHARTAALSATTVALFKERAKDKTPGAYLFTKADGEPWGKSEHHRPFREACTRAELPRVFIPYSLRHYYISQALRGGMDVNMVAKNTGTSAAQIWKTYQKFIRSDVRTMLDAVDVA